jgi:hypothetical protein
MDNNNASSTYEYWDNVDGEAMVCSPFGPREYLHMCFFVQYILGTILTAEGLSFLYNAQRLARLASRRDLGESFNQGVGPKSRRSRSQSLYLTRFTFALAGEFVGIGAWFLVGMGTRYSTRTLIGLFGDFSFCVGIAFALYLTFLQLKGAAAFRKLVQMPGTVSKKHWRDQVADVLDLTQSVGAIPFVVVLCTMLATRTITRSGFYAAGSVVMAVSGLRSVVSNILGRVNTLARVDVVQQAAGGSIDVKLRRRKILKEKARELLFHMLVIVTGNVVIPLAMVIWHSVYSSTQMLIHNGVNFTLVAILIGMQSVITHKQVNARYIRMVRATAKTTFGDGTRDINDAAYTVANESGMSAVGDSHFYTSAPRAGLFSEVETKH